MVWSTDEFRVGGLARPEFPILVGQDGELVTPAFRFLVHHCLHRGRAGSAQTWASYGYALHSFFSRLEISGRRWDEEPQIGIPSVLADYRTWASREHGNKHSTVNARLDILVTFYKFAHRHGWISKLPFEFEEQFVTRKNESLAHAVATPAKKQVADVKFRASRPMVKLLSSSQAKLFLSALTNKTHQLMATLQLATGIRAEELVSLPASYVVDPATRPDVRHMFPIILNPRELRTKGSIARTIHVPRKIMAMLWAYKALDRNTRATAAAQPSKCLFLTEEGTAFDRKTVWRIYAIAAKRNAFHVNPHMLRHTYATHTLAALARSKNIGNALLYVRNRLGHVSVTTTEKYLHYIEDVAESVMNDYQNELTTMLEAASA